jgi:hypothetical protein
MTAREAPPAAGRVRLHGAGGRIVRACPALGWLASTERDRAEAVVIHEVLHTLGLQENPPTSEQITAAVERRCPSVP